MKVFGPASSYKPWFRSLKLGKSAINGLSRNFAMPRYSSDMSEFRRKLEEAQRVVILTGAGVSAESGVPTFRGAGGLWRKFNAPDLASMNAFKSDPSLVWEFYHYRRELVRTKRPNPGHTAIAKYEEMCSASGKSCVVITQNVDELHRKAESKNLLELHGSLFTVRCTDCGAEYSDYTSPICESLRDKGAPDRDTPSAKISPEDLPRCKECAGLLRPGVVWFGENLDPSVLRRAEEENERCDICLVVGTSSVVYPAAMFAPNAARRGAIVAEFNLEETPVTKDFQFHFQGPCGETVPKALL